MPQNIETSPSFSDFVFLFVCYCTFLFLCLMYASLCFFVFSFVRFCVFLYFYIFILFVTGRQYQTPKLHPYPPPWRQNSENKWNCTTPGMLQPQPSPSPSTSPSPLPAPSPPKLRKQMELYNTPPSPRSSASLISSALARSPSFPSVLPRASNSFLLSPLISSGLLTSSLYLSISEADNQRRTRRIYCRNECVSAPEF